MSTAEVPSLAPGDTVRVVNKGSQVYIDAWDSKRYVLHPDRDAFVPFEAMACWVGDPRATANVRSMRNEMGAVAYIPDRETEVRRLRMRHGIPIGHGTQEDVPVKGSHPEASTDPRMASTGAPILEVYDLQGNRITTVVEDPKGEGSTPAAFTVSDHNQMLEALQRQQAQNSELIRRIEAMSRTQTDDAAAVAISEDELPEDVAHPGQRTPTRAETDDLDEEPLIPDDA